MLKSIKIKNFHSIGDMQEMSLQVNQKDILDDSARVIRKTPLNMIACLVGANGSGKTTFLKTLSFISWLIRNSYQLMREEDKLPYQPHMLMKKKNSMIKIEFFNQKILYSYEIEFNPNQIVKESLKKRAERISPVFEVVRSSKDTQITIIKEIKINPADKERFKRRKNATLLSCLIDTNYLPDIKFFKYIESNVTQLGLTNNEIFANCMQVSEILFKDEFLRKEILNFSNDIDLEISNFQFSKISLRDVNRPDQQHKKEMLQCEHIAKKGKFLLDLFRESNGTQHAFALLVKILPLLKTGGLIILDEIESALHPDLVRKIIFLFENKTTNPHHAQLIFSTHLASLLKDRHKTQIFITDKDKKTLETEIYRLDEVEGVRNDENYFNKYLAGAYGGIPNIYWLK